MVTGFFCLRKFHARNLSFLRCKIATQNITLQTKPDEARKSLVERGEIAGEPAGGLIKSANTVKQKSRPPKRPALFISMKPF